MTDIVEWLRAYANRTTVIDIKRLDEAAAEIERLRAALRQIAGIDEWDDCEQGYVDKARAALDGQPAPGKVEPRTDSRYNNAERIFGDD